MKRVGVAELPLHTSSAHCLSEEYFRTPLWVSRLNTVVSTEWELPMIPDDPELQLKNYLLNLVDGSDGKGRNIYIKNASHFTEKIWAEIASVGKRSLHVRKLSLNKLGISCSSFYHNKNGKKAISISTLYKLLCLWQELCNKSPEEFKEKWDELFHSDLIFCTHSHHQKVVLPRFISPKLAYLMGWICGDGNLNHSHGYVIAISEKSKSQLELVLRPLLHELFHIYARIFRKTQGGYILQVGRKPVFRFLTNVLNLRVGRIPLEIKKAPRDIKRYFLAGIFDAEGYVNRSYLDSQIVITQANRSFLEELIGLFKEFDINFSKPLPRRNEKGTWAIIRLRKKREILKFATEIGSFHIDKFQKLKKLVMQIEKNWCG